MDYEKLSSDRLGETSETIRKRVQAARAIQNQRFTNSEVKDIVYNADMRVREVRQFYQLGTEGQSLMHSMMSQLNLSVRLLPHPETVAYHHEPCWE